MLINPIQSGNNAGSLHVSNQQTSNVESQVCAGGGSIWGEVGSFGGWRASNLLQSTQGDSWKSLSQQWWVPGYRPCCR